MPISRNRVTTRVPCPSLKVARSTGFVRSIAHWLASDGGATPRRRPPCPVRRCDGMAQLRSPDAQGLRGRVVLVDFWTYTCVNWIRTLPYVRAWASKYEEAGLTVVGVHTPEFGFESDLDNVVAQTRNLGVEYPVAVDSEYRVWGAFANRFWPAIYIADAEGRIRHHHFGEGEYPQTEMVIQRLLLDAGAGELDQDLVAVEPRGLEVAADWKSLDRPRPTGAGAEQRFRVGGHRPARPPARVQRGEPTAPQLLGSGRGTGQSPAMPPSRTRRAHGSPSSSRRATSTSSWARSPRVRRSHSGSPRRTSRR